jgi:hypothetical protein
MDFAFVIASAVMVIAVVGLIVACDKLGARK